MTDASAGVETDSSRLKGLAGSPGEPLQATPGRFDSD